MTVIVYSTDHLPHRKPEVARAADLDAARAWIETLAPILHWEEDADHPGCADCMNVRGELFAVEPAPTA